MLAGCETVELAFADALISATEEMQKISDDLRDAGDTDAHTDIVEPEGIGSSGDAEPPIENHTPLVAPDAWADFRHFPRETH